MILGITGGVASGKSTLAAILAELGAPYRVVSVSADVIARELLAPGTGLTARVLLHFGASIRLAGLDDAIDRGALGRRILAGGGALHAARKTKMAERFIGRGGLGVKRTSGE